MLLPFFIEAQQKQLENLHRVLKNAANDTLRMDAYHKLGVFYDDVNLDSSVYYGEKGISVARKLKLKLNEAEMLMITSFPLAQMGNYPQAFKMLMKALEITEDPSSENNTWHLLKGQTPQSYRAGLLGYTHLGLGNLYVYTGNYEKQITEFFKAKKNAESIKDSLLLAFIYADAGDAYFNLNKLDSALSFEKLALKCYSAIPFKDRKYEGGIYSSIGGIYQQLGNIELARKNYERAVEVSEKQNNPAHTGQAYLQLASLCQLFKKPDSGLLYAKKAFVAFTNIGKEKSKVLAYRMISDFYGDKKITDSSLAYLRLATLLNDSLDRIEKKKLQEFQVAGFNEQLRLQELEKERTETQNKFRTYAMLATLGVFLLIGLLLYRNNREKQKANRVLQKTLTDLKSTQSQLIQSEKMASLGELTAGIAHEIQNPLNFVNNFSDVNAELIEELKNELASDNRREALLIADDIKDNEKKINHHGKRAEAIVKGMLQHSQASTGKKEPTNINALADEYLRLAYHGLRAKDKDFNADIKTAFDESIGNINIIPQDIGRVLLNLYNNAFYAVCEKKKQQAENYEPTVSVSTKKINGKVEISVKDNGDGIPQKIVDKIFQPFFTTKPTGQGTGLGLSLSYDIIKAHGGEIKVETKEGEVTTFIIQLPI
ncbi:hypothetical protein BH10BAC2_BH10BAC2_39140 [soil metagenome]